VTLTANGPDAGYLHLESVNAEFCIVEERGRDQRSLRWTRHEEAYPSSRRWMDMAGTSKKAASKVLRDGRLSKTSKLAAGSALSQKNAKKGK
jgi:hypothetical protein